MKMLKKLSISPEKVIKKNELINLRGGFGEVGEPCTCTCYNASTFKCLGYVFAPDGDCVSECHEFYNWDGNVTGECGNLQMCQQ
jgi:hypothetical protein